MHIADKEIVSRLYRELLKISKKNALNPMEKLASHKRGDGKIRWKICLTSQAIWEMQMKTTR